MSWGRAAIIPESRRRGRLATLKMEGDRLGFRTRSNRLDETFVKLRLTHFDRQLENIAAGEHALIRDRIQHGQVAFLERAVGESKVFRRVIHQDRAFDELTLVIANESQLIPEIEPAPLKSL